MTAKIGVGFVGAGAVIKSVHAPTLARMGEDFSVAAVWDVDPRAAESVGSLTGARCAQSFEELLADDAVEVLVIGTPAAVHAEQVVRGMRAGKRAILCEKPLGATTEDARLVAEAAAETGVPLLVGAMHVFDPAWLALRGRLDALVSEAVTVRSSIALPFNDRFEAWSTELGERAAPAFGGGDIRQMMMRLSVMELAIHDLPLVRAFLPEGAPVRVTAAALAQPFGYGMSIDAGGRLLDLFGYVSGVWRPDWELEVIAPSATLHLAFTPSFVHAGSAIATLTEPEGKTVFGPFAHNGYEGEWRAIRDLIRGKDVEIPPVAQVLGDLRFALDIADQSCALLAGESQS